MSVSVFDWYGKTTIPSWWLRRALPLLERDIGGLTAKVIAERANVFARRESQWDYTAVSKFRSGAKRPIALAHAISRVFNIPSPFYVAATEAAAVAMTAIEQAFPDEELPDPPEAARRARQLAKIDSAADQLMANLPHPTPTPEIGKPILDGSRARGVASTVYGANTGPETPRADRTRTRRP